MATRSANINVIAAAAIKAARGLNRDFGEIEGLQASPRGPNAFAAAAVERAGEIVGRELARTRRGFAFAGRSAPAGPGPAWLVEPLSGIENFRHGLPWFATVIGILERGQATAGAVYDPLRDALFWAERGSGAYINNSRLRVSARAVVADAVVALDTGAARSQRLAAMRHSLASEVGAVRETGCPALDLAHVAAGRLDGFWGIGLVPMVAEVGVLLVREAGGLVPHAGGPEGEPPGLGLVAANAKLADRLAALLRAAADVAPAA
jgi:myo-inositol-1(or 4)-monophosphatase